ncbi:acyltransferase [Priestia megaterium]|uniref:acyltransferase n=1 Tax=Priestia megaterium TaxID=1404 RepID=UPI002EAFDD6F|nr:acyltransferase [Priestia megaterium]
MKIFRNFFFFFRKNKELLQNKFIFKKNSVRFGDFPTINGTIFMRNNGGEIYFGKSVKVNSRANANPIGGDTRTIMCVGENAILKIGDLSGISNSSIICTTSISIGNKVLIGGGTKIWDTDFHPLDPIERMQEPNKNMVSKEVRIGNNVFIGGNSIILKGVSIGDNSVIGAGAVVTKNVPENEIWAGNPAKFIRKI